MQHVIGAVEGDDVQRAADEEEANDTHQQVDATNRGVDRLGEGDTVHACVEQRGADGQVDDVVKRVHGEDDEVGALGGKEADSRGDKESEHAYQEVNGSEDGGDQAIGRSTHWSEPSDDGRETPAVLLNPKWGSQAVIRTMCLFGWVAVGKNFRQLWAQPDTAHFEVIAALENVLEVDGLAIALQLACEVCRVVAVVGFHVHGVVVRLAGAVQPQACNAVDKGLLVQLVFQRLAEVVVVGLLRLAGHHQTGELVRQGPSLGRSVSHEVHENQDANNGQDDDAGNDAKDDPQDLPALFWRQLAVWSPGVLTGCVLALGIGVLAVLFAGCRVRWGVALRLGGRRRLLPLRRSAGLWWVARARGNRRLCLSGLVWVRFLRVAHGSAPFGSLQRRHLTGHLWTAPGSST